MASLMPETDSEDELPPEWEERATLEGEVYYANHFDKSTQWVHPRTGKRKEVSGSLPFGWERQRLPDGKILYVNHDEQKTTYIDPRLAFAKECNDDKGIEDFRQRFDASSNALQVLHGQDLSGKTAIVTGASDGGIGYEMARTLARSGCTVIFACRDANKANISIGKVKSERTYVNLKCHAMHLDLASLASVKMFSTKFYEKFQTLDILILNAGIMGHHHTLTEDNFELTFQVNYLSHFYLSQLLKPALFKAAMPKIISVSAESHRYSLMVNPDEFLSESCLNKTNGKYFCPTFAYNDSKLFCLMFALEANQIWKNIRVIAVHPGNMVSSNLSRHWWLYRLLFGIVRPFSKSLSQAAASGIFAAASPEMKGVGGIYINNCFPCQPSKIASNPISRKNLFETSLKLLQMRGHAIQYGD